ncbi:PREDICTED: uncharacterized protein LOC109487565 [Branchiostoma belcheri]|uniref:Uncharacterized protein LOC109487565 n=1 Tax=Branchiostoma belcheri TaxID=7741 RepID=A0A6P5AVM1_BRABE|nr:PREDICTED: uncharacterized protein LOC109487565 [Branchiostoma belcheri]
MRSTKAKCPHGPEGTIFGRVQGGPACRKLAVKKFSDLLSKEQIRDLGPVSETWFEDLTAEALSNDRNAVQDDLQTPLKSHHHGNGQTNTAATPVPDGKAPITPSSCSPSLFSPNVPECNRTDQRSRFRLENNMGQSTPVLPQSQKKFLGFSGVSQLTVEDHHTLGHIQPIVGLSPGVGGSPLPILPETESSVLSRRLFKTPQGPSSQGFFSEPMASRFLPTPERLTVTLGGDLNCSALSWTSSMATPGTAAMATPGTAAMVTPTAAMATTEAVDPEDVYDQEEDLGIATDGKKLARALFVQCEEEADADPDLKPTQDKSQSEESLRDVSSTQRFQLQRNGTQEFESTLAQTNTSTTQETTASESKETAGRSGKHGNSDLNDTKKTKVQTKVAKKDSSQSHGSSGKNSVQDEVDKTLDFLFAKSERRSQKKDLPPPKRRKWNRPTSETQSGAVPLVGETGVDEDDSKDDNCKSGTVRCQQERNVSCITRLQCERSLNHVEEATESRKSTKPSNFVENPKGGQNVASPVSVVNMDFFSQISPTSLQEICEAADAAAEKSVESKNESSRDRYKLEHQIQSSTSNYKLLDKRVSNTKESGLGREDSCDTKSIGKDRKSIEGSSCSAVKGKNSDLQPDAVSLSESPSPTNPTQGTLDVMNVSSQVLKQQTRAQEGHLAADVGTARVEADKTTLGPSKQQKQTATPSLVFNLKVPAKKDSLQDTPKFSVTTSASTMNKGGSARRFFYPTSSQISRSTPKTLFPSNMHGNVNEFKGTVKHTATIPSSALSPSHGQGGKQNPLTTRDVAKGISSRTFRLSKSSASSRPQSAREHSKKDLNTEEPNYESDSDRNDFHKSDELSTVHNQSTLSIKMTNSRLPQLERVTNKTGCTKNRTTCSNDVITCPILSYGGFQTASRKEIRISETAMKKAAALAAEVDAEMAKTSTDMFSTSTCVDTASKKDVTDVTKDAIQKETRRTFSEAPRKDKCLGSGREFVGFSTASNKRIEISDKALKQAKAMMSEVDDSLLAEMAEHTDGSGDATLKDSRLPLPLTSRLVNFSTSTLGTAKAFSGEIDTVDQEMSNRQLQKECGPISNTDLVAISSTKTPASNHDVQKSYSDEASCNGLSVRIPKGGTKRHGPLQEFTGFQTASKKPIQVSSNAMKRAKIIAQEVEASMAGQGQLEEERDRNPSLNAKGLETTSTSDDVSSTKAVTGNLEDFVSTRTSKNQETSHRAASLHTTGFKTASKKPIQISADAMMKARSMAAEVEAGLASGSDKHQVSDQTMKAVVTGFTTASENPIRVAVSSMDKGKALIDEVEASLPLSTSNTSNSFTTDQKCAADCPGFRTASDKNISVSAESLQKARLLLAEVDEGKTDQLSSTEDGSARKHAKTTATTKPALENGTYLKPRGPLPFKPPSKVLVSGKCSELSGRLRSVRTTANNNSVHSMSTAAGAPCKPSQLMGEENSLNDSFHDDQLFCTQMVSAAEVAESTYAFLQAEKEGGGSDDDFGFSDQLENPEKTPDPSTSIFSGTEKGSFDSKETRSQDSSSKDKHHEIVHAPESESGHTNTANEAISKCTEVTSVVSQHTPKSSGQKAVAQENGTANPTEVQKTSGKATQGHRVVNKKLQSTKRKIVTVCDTVKEADTALLDESFDLAWGLVDEMVVKAMEASAQKSEENNTSANPGQDRQADTDHRHSLDSGLEESIITSQENNVSTTYSSSLEEPRYHSTCISQAGQQKTEDVSVKKHTQHEDRTWSYKSCPLTTASGRKASVKEGALKHVKEKSKEELLPAKEISVPFNKLSRCTSPTEVSHGSSMEHLRETLPEDNQLKGDEEMESSNNVGFSTAAGKKIQVSKKSLEKAGQLWDSTKLEEEERKTSMSGETDCPPKFQGFQTGSGHRVKVSDAALARAKQMWDDSGQPEQDMLAISADKCLSKAEGFKTASEKRMRISEKALQKAQQMWKEYKEPQGTPTCNMNASSSGFPGFQTASGHKVAVSEEALQKAQQLWKDTDRGETELEVDVKKKHCKTFPGLQTGGCKINVSTESLLRVKQMWKDEDENGDSQRDNSRKFATAEGKHVQVSEQARPKAEELCAETVKSSSGHKESSSGFHGFQTASGKKVDVSDQALSRAREMWRDTVDDYVDNVKDNDATTKDSLKCTGFQTAGGKKVHVSAEALQKAKLAWKNEVEETCPGSSVETQDSATFDEQIIKKKDMTCSPKNALSAGFKTASGRTVSVSETSLQRAKQMFQDVEEANISKSVLGKEPVGSSKLPEFQGFTTGRGQKIEVSKKSLQFAKNMWKESESGFADLAESAKKSPEDSEKTTVTYRGFQTAGGQKIHVSKEALQKAKALFSEDAPLPGSNTPEKTPLADQGQSNIGTEFRGFQTAKGQKIEVSKKSLQFAKNLWKESESGFDDPAEMPKKSPEDSEKTTVTYRGFQTAGGQKIHVSKEALQKAKALFSDDAPLPGNNSPEKSPLADQGQSNIGTEFRGFQTAKGQKIEVSKKSLQFAKNLWKESESGFDDPAEVAKKSPEDSEKTTVPYRGFQTAGGQKIHVSKEALQKAKALFSDDASLPGNISPENSLLTDQGQSNNGTEFRGFQTAKGQKIEVSEDALQKARAILSDDFNQGHEGMQRGTKVESPKDTNASKFAGFQTARGQQIEVSQEALQKARERLSEHKSMETDTGFAESTAEHSPPLQRSDPRALSSGTDKYGHGTRIGVPQDKEEQLHRDRSARKRTLTSSETKAIWPPSKRQSPSPAGYQALHVGHRQAFRPPLATHPEGVVHDRHGFSVRTRLQPLHSKPRQDFRRPPSVPPPTRRPVVSTPQAHNSTENSFKTPFKSPAPTFSAPFKAKPGKEDGETEYDCPDRATKDNIPDSQEACKDDNSKQTIHPEYGSLLQRRLTQQCRVGLREAVCSQTPGSYTTQELYSYGVHQSTCTVTCETAESFRFVCRDHVSPDTLDRGEGITLTDGGVLVPLEDGTAGKDEFVSALLDTPGVDPGLVTPEWIHNHYRWIVWKLAAMEAAFPVQFGGRCLTPDQVLMQLKYRYDREVDLSQRSALKKILERDDTPSKTLVLCVARITCTPHTISQDCATEQDSKKVANTKQKETIIELTDGWYGVRAALDPPLARLVESKRICVGQKLCVSGAELVGSQDACSPLEAPANLLLKLSANATRRARWDAKLGFHSNPQPFPVSLGSLCVDGGMVGCVDVMVLRSYPMQYMEKYPSGSSVVRSRRAEEKAARKHEGDRNRRMEKLYSQIQDKFERRTAGKGSSVGRRRKSLQLKTEDIENLQTGQEIYEALQGAMDPTEIEQCLSPAQRSRLYDHQRSLQAEQQGELQAEFRRALQQLDDEIPVQRNVVAMYRVRLADYQYKGARKTELTLTVWRPTDNVMDMLKEGRRLKIFHLSTSAARNQVQLASTRTTRYQDLPVKPDTLEEVYTPRKLATFEELCASDFSPTCGEVDVVGVVVYITGQSGNSSGVQTVFLADADGNLCSVKFWGGVSAHSLEDVLKLRALVGGVNLQWRPDDRLRVPCLTFGDQADFSQKPQHSHLREGLARLEESVKDVKSFAESMVQEVERVVYSRQAFSPGPANTSRAWPSPNPGNRTAPHTPGSRIFTPARAHSTPNNSVSTPRLLHCTSPAAQVTPYGGNASHFANVQSSGKGKPSAQSRRSLLDRVPSPPPLTTLVSPIPHRVKRAFKRPGLVPLNNGRGSPAFVPPMKRTLADVEGNDLNKAATDVGSGNVTEISDAEMASICTQNTPDKREGSVANDIAQGSTVCTQAQFDREQREDFISDTQLLTACTSENGPGMDTQTNTESPGQKLKVTPKHSKPFQRRGSGLQRRGRGRRGANDQGIGINAVQGTDIEMPGLQTTPVDCTTPEKETLAIPEDGGSSTPSAIDTVVIEDGIEKKTEVEGSSQDSVDSQNVATRTRSSLRLAKKRKR